MYNNYSFQNVQTISLLAVSLAVVILLVSLSGIQIACIFPLAGAFGKRIGRGIGK